MYRQKIAQKTSPLVNSTPISNAVPTSNYGSLSSIVQRAQQDVSSISGDERQQLESAIGTKATGEVLAGKQWVPQFTGVSSQLWGDVGIQAKLTIGEVGDKYEQEADRVAASVVEQINHPATVSPTQGEIVQGKEEALRMKPILQRREAIGGGEASAELSGEINRARGGGQPLEGGLQQSMGQAMGADFSMVRVHTDGHADRLNQSLSSRAFTTGRDLFFKQGEYQPGSRQGKGLIAHELTHVIQQNGTAHKLQRNEDEEGPKMFTLEEFKVIPGGFDIGIVNDLENIAKKAGMNETDNISVLFQKLLKYGRANITYDSGGGALKDAFLETILTLDCVGISELFMFLCLILKPKLKATIRTNQEPILYTGPIGQGGFKNQGSNVNGRQYIMYNRMHAIANVGGTLYDATTGLENVTPDDQRYVIGEKLDSSEYTCNEAGHLYQFVIDGRALHLIKRNEDPNLGLRKYDVVPNEEVQEVIPNEEVQEVIPRCSFFGFNFCL